MSTKAKYKVMSGDEVVILAGEHRESTAKVVRFVNDGDRVELPGGEGGKPHLCFSLFSLCPRAPMSTRGLTTIKI